MPINHVEDLLDDWRQADPERCALLERVRKLVLAVDPRITEEAKYGGILFAAASPFCGLFSYERHVALEFSRGADLPDVHHVLEGDGKKRRHIKIVDGADLFKKNLRDYVAAAFAAAAGKQPAQGRARPRPRA
jgi:hypothetical protein